MGLGKPLDNQIYPLSYFFHIKTTNLPDKKRMQLFDTCCYSRQIHRVDINFPLDLRINVFFNSLV